MKRVLTLALVLAAGCVSESTHKAESVVELRPRPARKGDRPTVAVVAFDNKTPNDTLGPAALDVCETGLVNCKQFNVVERTQISKILDEHKIEHSGLTDQSTAVQVGGFANAKYIVLGAITNFGSREEKSHVSVFSHSKEYVLEAEVDIKIIDVAHNSILAKKSGRGLTNLGSTNTVLGGSTTTFDVGLQGKALRGAIYEALDQLIDDME